MASILEILSMPLEERKNSIYNASRQGKIEEVEIDGNIFKNYGQFSFLWAKTYPESPTRSINGVIEDLPNYASFLTSQLQINFAIMSIDDYRRIMKLLYSKNEFTVSCYDIVYNERTTNKMYFATEQMPKLYTIARAFNSEETWVELLGIEDYTVEMIGTNSGVETYTITYEYNIPSDAIYEYNETRAKQVISKNISVELGSNATVTSAMGDEIFLLSNITFHSYNGDTYSFKYWSDNLDGTGLKYLDGEQYLFRKNIKLYAIWQKG